jgi:DNA-binding transcriptional LysR family regulator
VDRYVDLVEEDIDVAIRIDRLNDSSLAARRSRSASPSVIATPAYLAKHGTPQVPQGLSNGHNCLLYCGFSLS